MEERRRDIDRLFMEYDSTTRSYRAAKLRGGGISTSPNTELRFALPILRNLSRASVRDDPTAAGYLDIMENNVIGPSGIQLQVNLPKNRQRQSSQRDTIKNKELQIEKLFQQWGRKCDASETLNWDQVQRLILRSLIEDGEAFVRMVVIDGQLRLEIIPTDRVDLNYERPTNNGGSSFWVLGVELNNWRRPLRYAILSYDPSDASFTNVTNDRYYRFVPAADVLHIFKPLRIGQVRGVPYLTPALTLLRHLERYEENTVIRARASAGGVAYIKTDSIPDVDEDNPKRKLRDIQPGKYEYIGENDEIVVPDWRAPSNEHATYITTTLRTAATGLGVSYETLSSDYSKSNFSSSRMASIKERNYFKVMQNLMIETLCKPVFEKFIDTEIRNGRLSLSNEQLRTIQNNDGYSFVPRTFNYIDPQKEVAANIDAVNANLKTLKDVITENGGDFEKTMEQRRDEVQLMMDYNLPTISTPSPEQSQTGNNDTENNVS